MLCGLAMPLPAMSNAVPWSTEVRTIGRPSVTLTPESALIRPLFGSMTKPRVFTDDVALVVVHRDHRVELAGERLDVDRVGGHRAGDVHAVRAVALDDRRDHVDVLAAEHAALAGMRVERAHADPRPLEAEIAQRLDASGR